MAAHLTSQNEIAGLGPKTDRPRLNTAIDLTKHKLTPTEGFVLSRVDGRSSYDEICMVSGLGRDETLRILREFKRARLILGPGEVASPEPAPESANPAPAAPAARPAEPAPAAPAARPAEPAPVAAPAAERKHAAPMGPLERLDDGSEVTADEIADWPNAAVELKTRIVRLHRRLPHLSAWELLGLAPDSDPATAKRAFAVASKELHPDRYFGKNLGAFKAKLAAIFVRVCEAAREIEMSRKED